MTSPPAATASRQTPIGEEPASPSLLRMWNPLRLCFGPSFAKEMRVTGRKGSTYSYRCGYSLLLLLVMGLIFFGTWQAQSGGGSAAALQQYQGIAPIAAGAVIWLQFIAVALLAPSLTGGVIADEKLARTLPSLMTTPLPAAEIVLGKVSARFVLLLILAAIPVPILLAVRVFGGLPASYIALSLPVSLSVFVLGLACGTLMSVRVHRASAAASAGLGLLMFIVMIPVIVMFALQRSDRLTPEITERLMQVFSPAVMTSITGTSVMGEELPKIGWAIGYNLVFSLLALTLAVVLCRRTLNKYAAFDAPSPVKQKSPRRGPRRRAGKEGDAPAEPASSGSAPDDAPAKKKPVLRFASTNRDVWNNPFLWRELRQPTFSSRLKLAVLSTAIVLFWAWFYYSEHVQHEPVHFSFAFIGLMIVGVGAASRTGGAIAQEREAKTFETLLTAPAKPRKILVAKFLGAFRQMWFVPAVLLVHFAVIGQAVMSVHWIVAIQLALIFAGTALLLGGVGTLFGLIFKRAMVASMMTQGLALAAWLFLPILYLVLYEMVIGARGTQVSDLFVTVNEVLNPFISTGFVLEAGIGPDAGYTRLTDLEYYLELTGPIGPFLYTALLSAYTLLGVLVAGVSIVIASRYFNRFVGRPS